MTQADLETQERARAETPGTQVPERAPSSEVRAGALDAAERDAAVLGAADARWMDAALDEARAARDADEVPVGAVVVRDGRVLGRGRNRTRELLDPTAHAELLAVRDAARAAGEERLAGATVYTTLEPCFMCAGALSHARVARVVWAVRDPKFGGCASLGRVLDDPRLNHRADTTEGVRASESRALLQSFFRGKRASARA